MPESMNTVSVSSTPSKNAGIDQRAVDRVGLALAPAVLLLLTGCGEWPPGASYLEEKFESNSAAFERLRDKLAESRYVKVTFPDAPCSKPSTVYAHLPDSNQDWIESSDDREWSELFQATCAWDVRLLEDDSIHFFMGTETRGDLTYYVGIDNGAEVGQTLKSCRPEDRRLQCGQCVVALDPKWWLVYDWSPDPGLEYYDESVPEVERTEQRRQELKACWQESRAKMGYELETTSTEQ